MDGIFLDRVNQVGKNRGDDDIQKTNKKNQIRESSWIDMNGS